MPTIFTRIIDGQIPGTLARINSLYIDVEKVKP